MPPTLDQRLAVRQRPPHQRVVMYQQWLDLLFLHWEWDHAAIQRTLPPGLTVDTFDGRAYVAIVPFFMCGIRPRFLPSVPGISWFMETNVRTYVYDEHGRPGVWFYSLEANQWLAVQLARRFFHLPYFYAAMHSPGMGWLGLTPQRPTTYHLHRRGTPAETTSQYRYRLAAETRTAEPDSLEFFLAERYLLFTTGRDGRLQSGQVYHTPYPLCASSLDTWDAHLLELSPLGNPHRPPDHIVGSPGVHVDIYPLQTDLPRK
jgi:uncharacterized protein